MSQPLRQRILKTTLPGPVDQAGDATRGEPSSSFGITLPVFVEEAGGGIIVDVDGNHLIDLAAGIAVTSAHPIRGSRGPRRRNRRGSPTSDSW